MLDGGQERNASCLQDIHGNTMVSGVIIADHGVLFILLFNINKIREIMMGENKPFTILLKLDRRLKDKLKRDAKKNFRSTTMHIQAILTNYFNNQSLPKDDYHDSDMSNLT